MLGLSFSKTISLLINKKNGKIKTKIIELGNKDKITITTENINTKRKWEKRRTSTRKGKGNGKAQRKNKRMFFKRNSLLWRWNKMKNLRYKKRKSWAKLNKVFKIIAKVIDTLTNIRRRKVNRTSLMKKVKIRFTSRRKRIWIKKELLLNTWKKKVRTTVPNL